MCFVQQDSVVPARKMAKVFPAIYLTGILLDGLLAWRVAGRQGQAEPSLPTAFAVHQQKQKVLAHLLLLSILPLKMR